MKTSELTGAALDYAVAKCEGYEISYDADERDFWLDSIVTPVSGLTTFGWLSKEVRFSTDWAQGGVILEREKITVGYERYGAQGGETWDAVKKAFDDTVLWLEYGPTPLIAAMRCYCCAKLGDEIEIPQELQPCQQP